MSEPNLASRNDMGRVARHVASRLARVINSERRLAAVRSIHEWRRRRKHAPHRVDYFHQVDDPYSHLAVQALVRLRARTDVEWRVHLAAPCTGPNVPEPEMLAALARRDCAAIAPHYGLSFPADAASPSARAVREAERTLAAALTEGPDAFLARAVTLGSALWSGDAAGLAAQATAWPTASEADTDRALSQGAALREQRGHYSGATFYHGGEWHWGVDRLHHLERRLRDVGAASGPLHFPRPAIPMAPVPRGSEISLEVFPSLRSPYTAVGFDATVELAKRTGIRLVVRPVLPMVMRGVPVTFAKGMYIFRDARREGETLGWPFGRMIDPIGEPVRRAYSLWPWARDCDRGSEFLSAFLRAAWADGIDTSTDAGLRRVVERAGLPWEEAMKHLGDPAWEEELEANRLAMVEEMGQWGVPSYRLRGPEGAEELCCWGQDRLWLIGREIQARGGA